MRLAIPQAILDPLGGMPIQTTVKPMLDLVVTAKSTPWICNSVFAIVKGGIAYRRLQINDRVTVNDLQKIAFEAQGGLGMPISELATLSVSYQGVFGSNPNFTVNPIENTGTISNIPTQNAIFLSLSYTV